MTISHQCSLPLIDAFVVIATHSVKCSSKVPWPLGRRIHQLYGRLGCYFTGWVDVHDSV